MENFTPISGFIGGLLIGFAASLLLYLNKKICGISGILGGILPPVSSDYPWRICFLLGLFAGGFILKLAYPIAFDFSIDHSPFFILGCGLLVGFGSRFGSGCTSGHGVCGIGRLSPRSFIATALFFTTAIITASLVSLFRGS